MPPPEIELLEIQRGSIVAPAGCGKTQLIADCVAAHKARKPVLILTHTNAGVAALRRRLERLHTPPKAYRLLTIDGWSMRMIATFPQRAGHNPEVLAVGRPRDDYPAIRLAARRLLQDGHIHELLAATYDRLIVDEFQDCNTDQHATLNAAAGALPTCVLGDPMQAVFGFGGNRLVDWQQDVCAAFPAAGTLQTPWRWINADAAEFGAWLLQARHQLETGVGLDLEALPTEATWVQVDQVNPHARRLAAANTLPVLEGGKVLIIGESRGGHGAIACQTPGAVTVESVELPDLFSFGSRLDLRMPTLVAYIADFAQSMMTGVGATNLVQRVQSITSGRARNPPSNAEAAALALQRDPCLSGVRELLVAIRRAPGTRMYRPLMYRLCLAALDSCSSGRTTFPDALRHVREQNRLLGRGLPKRAVGSTLLLKGLEADVAVVLFADTLDAKNLYVAMTRGASRLILCSQHRFIGRHG